MFLVKRIVKFGYPSNPSYKVTVDLTGTNSWYKRGKEQVAVNEIEFNVYYHMKHNQWRVNVPLVWKVVNEKLGCIQNLLEERQERIVEIQSSLEEYNNSLRDERYSSLVKELNDVLYDWNPCTQCRVKDCNRKYLAYVFYPKIRIDGGYTSNTWLLAMNTGSAIAKMVNNKYPAGTKQNDLWVGIRKCSDCIFSQYIKRDSDPDCFDAVQGVITFDRERYDEVERAPSLMDKREKRDTRERDPSMRCIVTNSLIFDEDSCTDYIWKALLSRNCDWVPAAPSASLLNDRLIGGVGPYAVEIPKDVRINV